mgnify:FL=1
MSLVAILMIGGCGVLVPGAFGLVLIHTAFASVREGASVWADVWVWPLAGLIFLLASFCTLLLAYGAYMALPPV